MKTAVDLDTATAGFTVRNHGRTVHGSVPVRSGEVVFDAEGGLESVTGVVELAAIDTHNAKRDRDLRKAGLLDLDAHPMAGFTSGEIARSERGWTVRGSFTARGRSIPLEFAVTVEGDTWEGTAQFDRKALGVRAPSFIIGRTITVTVRATLGQDRDATDRALFLETSGHRAGPE